MIGRSEVKEIRGEGDQRRRRSEAKEIRGERELKEKGLSTGKSM
jgi:hypothetical protein